VTFTSAIKSRPINIFHQSASGVKRVKLRDTSCLTPSRLHSKKIDTDLTSIVPSLLPRGYQVQDVGFIGDIGW
jgi:hypothetical protein